MNIKRIMLLSLLFLSITSIGQEKQEIKKDKKWAYEFGKGFKLYSKDSSSHVRFGLRFQSLMVNSWSIKNDNIGDVGQHEANFLIRRARLKFNGHTLKKRVHFKFEMGMSNRDISGGDAGEFKKTSNLILDAVVKFNVVENLWIWVGQTKVPGNRERVISSANLQMVDRSMLNSKFSLDRDFGIQLRHKVKIGKTFIMKEYFSFGQGEGRNITSGNLSRGGFSYTGKLEFYPFGEFKSKGDYKGGDLKREQKPKLAVAVAFNYNDNAVRERGVLGSFVTDGAGDYVSKDMTTWFADLMFKYKGFSFMAEYAKRSAGDAYAYDSGNNVVGTYYLGQSLNLQTGYLFKSNWELSARTTFLQPDVKVSGSENEYALGVSRYIFGHQLKVQADMGYSHKFTSDDKLFFRFQIDFHL
jgi:hypothetical protein